MTNREEIIASIDSLPTLPTAVAQLSRLITQPDSTARDFEAVIRPDPSLTANLLRLANSAYFGLRREVTSVKQAITLLGSKRVFEIAASAGFSKVIPTKLQGYDISSGDFWLHSVAVAILSETFARELRIPVPGLLFTTGLLHDIGKLAIGSFLRKSDETLTQWMQKNEVRFDEAEREILGCDHQQVGEEIALRWDLPEMVVWGTRWHHTPNLMPDTVDSSLVDLIHVADATAHLIGYGTNDGELKRHIDEGAADRIGFSTDALEEVAAMTKEQISDMSEMLT